jgi:hypothetical protein
LDARHVAARSVVVDGNPRFAADHSSHIPIRGRTRLRPFACLALS